MYLPEVVLKMFTLNNHALWIWMLVDKAPDTSSLQRSGKRVKRSLRTELPTAKAHLHISHRSWWSKLSGDVSYSRNKMSGETSHLFIIDHCYFSPDYQLPTYFFRNKTFLLMTVHLMTTILSLFPETIIALCFRSVVLKGPLLSNTLFKGPSHISFYVLFWLWQTCFQTFY